MIRVQGLNKNIQDKEILKDINVDINKGRLTSMIGPNGAGKSTLLAAITRLMDFEDGSIEIEGKSISDYKSNNASEKINKNNISSFNIEKCKFIK